MCGNGARCIFRFAHDMGIAGETMTVETDAGLVPGWRLDENTYRVKLNDPSILDLHRKGDVAYVELGCPGVPHGVAAYGGDLWGDKEALREQMRSLRFDPAFPKGANINFYQQLAPGEVKVLTFERGVEDFTLACGTGTGSVACTMLKKGLLPEKYLTAHNPGGTLKVRLETEEDRITGIFLEGPTQFVSVHTL
jgi:diaminopimelate epimerase